MNSFEMRTFTEADKDSPELKELEALYTRAFPPNERRPLEELTDEKSGMIKVLGFYQHAVFCGMAVTLSAAGLVHIIYLAMEERFRGQGLGSLALEEIRKMASGQKIMVDVERVEDGAPNNDQRIRRIAFYRKNGYEETEVRYRWRKEDYVILSCGGIMTKQEWKDFWDEVETATGKNW